VDKTIIPPEVIKLLVDELNGGWLEVCKIPTKRGYIRVSVSVNCEWYSRLCAAHTAQRRKRYRKPRTIIKRCVTLKALDRMSRGNMTGVYAARIIDIAREMGIISEYNATVCTQEV